MNKDLFGNILNNNISSSHSPYQRFKTNFNYRKSGSDMRCGNCKYAQRWEYHNKYYWKCELLGVSRCTATDIRKSYVCDNYTREGDK
jgi:hypothetical protein